MNSGCGHATSAGAHTKVASAELYKTGNSQFDEFFDDLYDVQQKSKGATQDERAARAQLASLVRAEDSVDDLLRKTRARADELAQSKAKVHLDFEGADEQGKPLAGKPITVKVRAKGHANPKDVADFATSLEGCAKAEGQAWEKYAPLSDRSRRLADKAAALLEQVDKQFESQEKRSEVKAELASSKTSLKQIADQTDD